MEILIQFPQYNTIQKFVTRTMSVIGHIHGAIVAATVGAIVGATVAATIAPTGCGDDRPVYTAYKLAQSGARKQIVAYTTF